MKAILPLLLSALLSTVSAGDVFIYRGVDNISADLVNGALFGKSLNAYVIVDYTGQQFGSLFFGHLDGGKHFVTGYAQPASFGSAPLPKGRTSSFFISGANNTDSPPDFYIQSLLMRGTDNSLLIRKNPGATLANRPKVLKGNGVTGSSSLTGDRFISQRFGLTFQATATIKANNANQTIDQVVDTLAAGLSAKGFTPP